MTGHCRLKLRPINFENCDGEEDKRKKYILLKTG